eukprot:COSAG02_NODE_9218_length_2285_cov_2.385178_2_plen_194_part_00
MPLRFVWFVLLQVRDRQRAERAARDAADDFERGFDGSDGATGTRPVTASTFGQPTVDPVDRPAEQLQESVNETEDSVEYLEDGESDEVYLNGEEIEQDLGQFERIQQQQQVEPSSFVNATQQVAEEDYVGVVGALHVLDGCPQPLHPLYTNRHGMFDKRLIWPRYCAAGWEMSEGRTSLPCLPALINARDPVD